MELVHTYLDKYRSLVPPEESKAKILLSVIREECGMSLESSDIVFERGGVFVSCHPTVRSELMQCAPHILDTLHSKHNVRLAFIR